MSCIGLLIVFEGRCMRNTANPVIFEKLEIILQRLLDGIQDGYTNVVFGQVSLNKALRLVAKFDIKYQVFADKNLRARRKRNGMGNAKLLCLSKNGIIYWWLMVTPPNAGEHLAHISEKLTDFTKATNTLSFGKFELVQLPYSKPCKVKPTNYKERNKATRLTWRLTTAEYENFRIRIIEDVRTSEYYKLFGLIRAIYSMPGFGGIRSQVGKLVKLYSAEIKRAGVKNAPPPLKSLPYIRRLADRGIRLSVLVEGNQFGLAEDNGHD